MSRLQILFLIGFLTMTCDAFWWGSNSESNSGNNSPRSEGSSQNLPPPIPPALRQYPISYIRAFAYHPVAFPQPLAPITTYTVRGQQQQLPSRSLTQQQLPHLGPQDFGTPPTTPSTTTTTTTTTTTPPPTTQAPFTPSQQIPQSYARGEFGQRQLPFQPQYSNYGGYPYYYNQQYHYRYDDQQQNQFSSRLYPNEPQFQQYSVDPVSYQFIPTSVTPLQQQNSVKFVPCMCPVAVQVSPPLNIKERTNESDIQVLSQTSTEATSPVTSSEEDSMEEAK